MSATTKKLAAAAAVVALAWAAPAAAQSPTARGYDESGVLGKGYDESGVLGDVSGGERDGLPFTGFEAGLVAFMGAALVGTGVALRRTSRARS